MPDSGPASRLIALSGLTSVVLGLFLVGLAQGERTQYGSLIVSLDGQLSPLALPRERLAPVAVQLDGSLQTDDGSVLPQVTRVELGLPQQGALSTHGLPVCPHWRIRVTDSAAALRACHTALVGHGQVNMTVQLPNQDPFDAYVRLLAFNTRIGKSRAVLLHAYAPKPPFSVVLPFLVRHRTDRFGMALVADLPALGQWARVAKFEMRLSRRYSYQGRRHSYLNASCPIPKRFTAGFFSFARVAYSLADGRQVSTTIARSCRAR
jgi:hypothetical protein